MSSNLFQVNFVSISLIALVAVTNSLSFNSYDSASITSGRNVLFVETRLDVKNIEFSNRVACSIESAARLNPERNVILFYAHQERLKALKISPVLDAMFSYSNVFLFYANLTKISVGSPMEEVMRTNGLRKSKFPVEHLSDAARLLLLWKYGGTYLDSDVIVRRNFDTVPSNFVCMEIKGIPGGVLSLNHEKDGLEIIQELMKEFAETYNPNEWAACGPHIITRVSKRLCGTNILTEIGKMKMCKGFNFLKREECYALRWMDWEDLMTTSPEIAEKVMNKVNESLTVHFYSHISRNHILKTDSIAPYIQLARQFCPRVLKASGGYF